MMRRLMTAFAAGSLFFSLLPLACMAATPKDHVTVPVIVELFTSEGCSSCPPADAVLQSLTKTQPIPGVEVIALGYHVDYWNQLGWRDPFSQRTFTQRQEQYRVRYGNENVYTPQMIVSGGAEFVGSEKSTARQQIAHAAEQLQKSSVTVSLAAEGNDYYTVNAQGIPDAGSARVFVAVTEDDLQSRVQRGENSGRHLTHVAVVRRLIPIVKQEKTILALPVGKGENRTKQHIVAWVQQGETGAILAATQIAR